jgi:protein SCO1/2
MTLLALVCSLVAEAASAHELTPDQLNQVQFDQRPGAQVPADALFRDETGETVRLGTYFGSRPIVLTMNYFHCQNLCPLELDGVIGGLNGLPFTLGDDFTMVTISMDPREGPADALDAKARALRGYVHPSAAGGWHVLTGDHVAIDAVADAIGFQYAYDAQQNDFAHPAGVVILTPQGHVSKYLYGIDFSSNDLRLALVDAASERIGSLIDRALLVCYHYDPITGRYTPLVFQMLQIGAAVTLLAVVVGVGLLWRAERRAR